MLGSDRAFTAPSEAPARVFSVREKILGIFLLTALVLGGILAVVLHANRQIYRVSRIMVEENLAAVKAVTLLELSLMAEDDAIIRYLLAGDPTWLETQQTHRSRVGHALLQIRALSKTRAEEELLREIDVALPRYQERVDRILAAHTPGTIGVEQANRLRRENSLLPEIYRKGEALLAIHQGLLERNRLEADRIAGRFRNLGYVTMLMVAVSTLALGLFLRINVLVPIHSLAEGARAYGQGHLEHRVTLHGKDELAQLGRTFNEMAAALQRERGRLTEISITDELTRLKNFRHFASRLEEEVQRAERYGHHLSLVLFDIDHFKQYNDTHGHPAGNEVLRVLGRLLKDNARGTDILARYGGEEFAIILPVTPKEDAHRLAEKIRNLIEIHPFPGQETQPGGRLTVSAGVASVPDDSGDSPLLLDAADRALYAAKRAGRNQVLVYSRRMREEGRMQAVRVRRD